MGFWPRDCPRLRQEGARVAVAARTKSELDSLADEIRRGGGEVLPFSADLWQPQELVQLVRQEKSTWGRLKS